MNFEKEPPRFQEQQECVGVLLCNLGTPEAPTVAALRRYLAEFLGDPRVVEIPPVLWRPLLHGFVLRTRPAKSAAKYAAIWSPEGSPLKVWTEKQALLLQDWLRQRGHYHLLVRAAMRHGHPSMSAQLDALKREGATRILILPAYPQYSGATTASVVDAVCAWACRIRRLPELRFVNGYHDDSGYIEALARAVERHWDEHGRPGAPERLVMSFHGMPERTRRLGDPYADECQATAHALARRLGLAPEQWRLGYQSRFGKARWLTPDTKSMLTGMARAGVRRVDVLCPSFTSDCLETLEEISQKARSAFFMAGGRVFHYLPCLNDNPDWIEALGRIAQRHLQGWPLEPTSRLHETPPARH